jgi:hypothetical protein
MTQKGKRPQEVGNQDPPGVLKDVQIGRFNTTREDIVELSINSIQQCPLIPDYKDPTESILPIVVHTPEALICIDGWNLIEQARAKGQSTVRCHIFQTQEHSDIDVALRKLEARTKPVGGNCYYAELVRNTKIVGQMSMNSMENPIEFLHGGSRRGPFFTNNPEDDIREVLSERLGKSRSTINNYFNFGRYITDEAMDTMIAQNTGRAFFEKAQVNKRRWISDLESDGLAEESISNEISSKMLEWLREYQETGNIKPDYRQIEDEGDQTTEVSSEGTSTDENEPSAEQINTFNHRSPSDDNEIPTILGEEDVKAAMQSVSETLVGLIQQSSFDYDQTIEIIDEQIRQLAIARQIVIDIRDRSAKEEA